jgi:hypothetical protein
LVAETIEGRIGALAQLVKLNQGCLVGYLPADGLGPTMR